MLNFNSYRMFPLYDGILRIVHIQLAIADIEKDNNFLILNELVGKRLVRTYTVPIPNNFRLFAPEYRYYIINPN